MEFVVSFTCTLNFMPTTFCAFAAIILNRSEVAARRTCRVICHQRTNSQANNAMLTETDTINSHDAFVIAGFG